MFLVDKKLQKTKLTLSLLAIFHSHLLYALEPSSNLTADVLAANNAQVMAIDANSMMWPLLPGESIQSLAALFYPKNATMQQRFATRTIQLNQQAGRSIDATTKTNLVDLILVPDIRSLGKHSGKIHNSSNKHHKKSPHLTTKLHLSYQLKDAKQFIVTEKMQADYGDLVQRNTSLKAELEKLNAKLAKLQLILAGLKSQAIDMLNRDISTAKLADPSERISKSRLPDSQTPAESIPAESKSAEPMAQKTAYLSTITAELPAAIDKDKKTLFDPLYFWFLAIFLLAITALAIAWRAFSQRQAKNLYLAANGDFDPLKTGIFDQSAVIGYQDNLAKVDFSLTQNGLSESMSVVDLSEVQGLDYQEEGEMILEQARIYVNIGRLEEATDLLKAQIKTMPKVSLHHWLYLLDIYREHQQKNEFLQYAKQLHETFNVMMPLWDNAALPMVIASSLEEFPHIVNNLTGLWANPDPLTDAQVYIEELLMDNRASERAGFSMEVFQELVTLRDLVTVRAKMAVSE